MSPEIQKKAMAGICVYKIKRSMKRNRFPEKQHITDFENILIDRL